MYGLHRTEYKMVRPAKPRPQRPEDKPMTEEVTFNQKDIFRALQLLAKEEMGRDADISPGMARLYFDGRQKITKRFYAKLTLKPEKKTPYRD